MGFRGWWGLAAWRRSGATVRAVAVLACAAALDAHGTFLAHASLVPISPELAINVYTTSTQREPDVAADGAGGFIVTWESFTVDDEETGIRARRYDSAGAPIGGEFQVNSYTTGYQTNPVVAASGAGFVIVWATYGPSPTPVMGQRFDGAGVQQGGEFQVNAYTTGTQYGPAVAADPTGSFVVTWTSFDQDGNYPGIFAQRYDTAGVALGGEFQVNSYTTGYQSSARVDVDATGDFVIVWGSSGQDGASGGVFAQRYDSAGTPAGSEFQVNTYTTSGQGGPAVGMAPEGGFVVVWSGYGAQDGDGFGIFGQRYDASGAAIGSEFQANSYTTSHQTRAVVAAETGGGFVVTWQSVDQDGSGYGIFARRFDAGGTAAGPELQVNTFGTSHQLLPKIARTGPREYAVVWDSFSQDGSFRGIFGRRIADLATALTGRRLTVRTPPGDPASNRVAFLSRDPAVVTPEDVADDPRCAPLGSGSLTLGARLRVAGTGGDFTIDLPCTGWVANAAGTLYRYRDASGATCQRVVITEGRVVRATCRGAQVVYALGVAQGDVNVVLSTGDPSTSREYCLTFGSGTSATIQQDGSNGIVYRAIDADTGACP